MLGTNGVWASVPLGCGCLTISWTILGISFLVSGTVELLLSSVSVLLVTVPVAPGSTGSEHKLARFLFLTRFGDLPWIILTIIQLQKQNNQAITTRVCHLLAHQFLPHVCNIHLPIIATLFSLLCLCCQHWFYPSDSYDCNTHNPAQSPHQPSLTS